jgi:4-aminobutyrate aminotransferase
MPIGATIARKSVMDWPQGAHGNTYGGNPVACAAALATLDLVESELMQNAAEQGTYLLDALAEIQTRHPSIGQVRGKGLMIGIEFVKDKSTKEPAVEVRDAVEHGSFENGLITLGCGTSTIRMAPPLVINQEQINEALGVFEKAVTTAEKKYLN